MPLMFILEKIYSMTLLNLWYLFLVTPFMLHSIFDFYSLVLLLTRKDLDFPFSYSIDNTDWQCRDVLVSTLFDKVYQWLRVSSGFLCVLLFHKQWNWPPWSIIWTSFAQFNGDYSRNGSYALNLISMFLLISLGRYLC